ncbi:hypothetical protein GME_06375 [Halomonas sp. TD01]|nr:hypothetical protein GME_06375 [Halomonas sp. TD01]
MATLSQAAIDQGCSAKRFLQPKALLKPLGNSSFAVVADTFSPLYTIK